MGNVAGAIANQHAQEMHEIVLFAAYRRRAQGENVKRAVPAIARELQISQSRVTEILRGRVTAVWSHELEVARTWFTTECARQAAALQHEAAMCRARGAHAKGPLT
jgi:hypothetical protein